MYKADYGLKLFEDGVRSDTKLHFVDFPLYSITVIAEGEYTTMVEMPLNGMLHALSLDFNHAQLDEILKLTSSISRSMILHELSKSPSRSRTIDLSTEINFNVVAKLGELQYSQNENYIPLLLQEIMVEADLQEKDTKYDDIKESKKLLISNNKVISLSGSFKEIVKNFFIILGFGILSLIGSLIYYVTLPFVTGWVTLGSGGYSSYILEISPAPIIIFFVLWLYLPGVYFFNQKLINISRSIIILSIAVGIVMVFIPYINNTFF